jgi:Sec-independent protein translocase protein TatA
MELSFGEILVILVIAFLVLGPDELVRKSRDLGRFVGRLKHQANNFRVMAEEEILKLDEEKRKLRELGEGVGKIGEAKVPKDG